MKIPQSEVLLMALAGEGVESAQFYGDLDGFLF